MTVHPTQHVTQAAEGLGRHRFTVAMVEAMVAAGILEEDQRIELIGGELVPMSAKGTRHEVLKIELNRQWSPVAPDSCTVAQETTFRLSEDTYLEPDFVVYGRETKLAALSGGNVLLVAEVADSSLLYDTGRKAAIYADFGVRELWVIDAVRLSIRIFRDPSPDGYRQTVDVSSEAIATPLIAPAAFALRLADLDLT